MTLVNCYTTLALVKSELAITDSVDDTLLEAAINAASREIDRYCGRRFWQDGSVVTRLYHAYSHTICYVDDISTATGLVVSVDLLGYGAYDLTLTVNNDFITEPVNAALDVPAFPYTVLRVVPFAQNYFPLTARPGVKVTAKFGWPAVPDDITKAATIQSAQLFKSKDAVFGVAAFGEFGPIRVRSALHPIAEGLLSPYAKPAVG